MGQANARGSFEQRCADAVAAGRQKSAAQAGFKLYKLHPVMQAAISAALGPLARAAKLKEQ